MKFVSANEDGYCAVADDTTVTSSVGIGPRSKGGFGLEIALSVELPNIDAAAATRLIDRAHEVCPYSNATQNNIDVKVALA